MLLLMPVLSTSLSPMPGSPAAIAIPALLDLHGPKLHALALRLCGHRADADFAAYMNNYYTAVEKF